MSKISHHKDIVTVKKKATGEEIKNVRCLILPNYIGMSGEHVIEEGDIIYRPLSNGGEDKFVVINPRFYEKRGNLPKRYEIEVKRMGSEAKNDLKNISVHITGNYNKFNHESIDNSTLTVHNYNQIDDILQQLIEEIKALKIPQQEMTDSLELVKEISLHLKSAEPKISVVKVLMKGLPKFENVLSIAASILQIVTPLA